MLILVFDTETTGVIPKEIYNIEKCPYIIQFSFIVYDIKNYKIVHEYNKIINIPKHIEIPDESTKIHGITKLQTNRSRTTITSCLQNFKKFVDKCDYIIGHNIDFDIKMVEIECQRNNIYVNIFDKPTKLFCTMQNSIDICKIEAVNIMGKYYKWPRLSELHEKLFNTTPNNLHDAFNDILICLRCAVFIMNKTDICYKDSVFKRKIRNLI
tara:strand:+ start:326 stop:958 length:633 start_codon:yes stop_codon:yes gene_type:complete